MQLISAMPSNWKSDVEQNNNMNTFTTTQHHFIRNLRFLTDLKKTSKKLYWVLIGTIKEERNLHDT